MRVGHIWDEAKAIADARGEKMTGIVEDALRRYVRRHQTGLPAPADGAGEHPQQVEEP